MQLIDAVATLKGIDFINVIERDAMIHIDATMKARNLYVQKTGRI